VSGTSRPKIPADAEWLWTNDNNNHNKVYCRYTPIKTDTKTVVPAHKVGPVIKAEPAHKVGPVIKAEPAHKVEPVTNAEPAHKVEPVTNAESAHKVEPVIKAEPDNNTNKLNEERHSSKSHTDVTKKMNEMNTRIISIIKETHALQKREIDKNKNNTKFAESELDKYIMKEEDEERQLNMFKMVILETNKSIALHYNQMNADSLYLKKLDLIKPQFLQTLDATNANFERLSYHVSELQNDEHKKFMQDLISKVKNQTVYDTHDLAQSFLAHYEKYKHVLRTDTSLYEEDVSKLKNLNNNYELSLNSFNGLKHEVIRLRILLASLKKTVQISETEAELFFEIERIISSILSSKNIKFDVSDGREKECAVSILKSHVANGLI
jgi:Ni,Fe-hydrogenase maturation factor